MGRAEFRRAKREQEKAKTVTYNLTKEQLDNMVDNMVNERLAKTNKETADTVIDTIAVLIFTLPMQVLKDYYWPKSYKKKLPEFTDHLVEYFEKFQNGELSMDKLKEDLWNDTGFKFGE